MYKPNMILWRTALQVFILVITVAWIYTPALNGEFLWDDTFLLSGWAVKSNSWGGLASIWFEPEGVDYFPITYTVLWLEWTAFGTNTFGYHLVNVLLHLSSCFLLWILLNRLKLHGAWLSALIYGIHPVCVESVAWISEIKNTLSLPFFLLTCLFWIKYDELRYKVRFNGYYYLSLGFFTVAMLAKPSVVATPFLALLYEWWKRGTVSRYGFYRVVPLFLIALVLGLITLSFQWERAIGDYTLPIGGVASRFAVAGMAIIFYCTKVFWPFNLMPMYPQWSVEPPQIWHLVPWVIISTVCFLLWLNRRGWGRDGTSNTFMILENDDNAVSNKGYYYNGATTWTVYNGGTIGGNARNTAPQVIAESNRGVSSPHAGGVHGYGLVDGSSGFLSESIDPATFSAMISRAGNDTIGDDRP